MKLPLTDKEARKAQTLNLIRRLKGDTLTKKIYTSIRLRGEEVLLGRENRGHWIKFDKQGIPLEPSSGLVYYCPSSGQPGLKC